VSQSGGDEEPQASGRGNIVALIAVVVLIALGYFAFNYIDHQRKLQNCLDSGRHNCEQRLNQG
jgi:predicted negative regulator of RcsB-dependent stress response